jgi:hypothetical protein
VYTKVLKNCFGKREIGVYFIVTTYNIVACQSHTGKVDDSSVLSLSLCLSLSLQAEEGLHGS